MGLLSAAKGSAGGVLGDMWKEYFYCDAIPANTIVVKGEKRTSDRSSNTKGTDNIITSGSTIAVADGQCMIIVDQGKVAEICAEPGEFVYDASTEPTVFNGSLGKSLVDSLKNFGKRFTYGGQAPKDQRVYYINIKEIPGNKYGTPNPVPFKVVDKNIGLDMDITIKCFGEYSFHICDPILFYTNVCGNVADSYKVTDIESQLKTELLTALQPAFAKVGELEIRYSALPAHTKEVADALNAELSDSWRNTRGIEIVRFGISSVTTDAETEAEIKNLQKSAVFKDPTMAAANISAAQADAMRTAAANTGGAAIGFMGMNMAANAGANAQGLYAMGQQNQAQGMQAQGMGGQAQGMGQAPSGMQGQPMGGQPQGQAQAPQAGAMATGGAAPQQAPSGQAPQGQAPADGWTCSCGAVNTGNFCSNCGSAKPQPQSTKWTCSCGAENEGKFCTNCGSAKPQ